MHHALLPYFIAPEGVPRLYDLVKVKDDKLRPAFFYAMGNTLVAQDLDQASRIAYGSDRRFRRVVTLQVPLCACLCVCVTVRWHSTWCVGPVPCPVALKEHQLVE